MGGKRRGFLEGRETRLVLLIRFLLWNHESVLAYAEIYPNIRMVGVFISRRILSGKGTSQFLGLHISASCTSLTTKAGKRQAKENDTDVSLWSTPRNKNSSLFDVFRKERHNMHLPAGKSVHGSADAGNLHDEILSKDGKMLCYPPSFNSSLTTYYIKSQSQKNKWRYELTVYDVQVNLDIYFRVVQPLRIFPNKTIILNNIDAKLKCPWNFLSLH